MVRISKVCTLGAVIAALGPAIGLVLGPGDATAATKILEYYKSGKQVIKKGSAKKKSSAKRGLGGCSQMIPRTRLTISSLVNWWSPMRPGILPPSPPGWATAWLRRWALKAWA